MSGGPALFMLSTSLYLYFGKDEKVDLNSLFGSEQHAASLSSIRRNDSEYSLGLSRNDSIDKDLTTLGDLCTVGQVAVDFTRLSLIFASGLWYLSTVYDEKMSLSRMGLNMRI